MWDENCYLSLVNEKTWAPRLRDLSSLYSPLGSFIANVRAVNPADSWNVLGFSHLRFSKTVYFLTHPWWSRWVYIPAQLGGSLSGWIVIARHCWLVNHDQMKKISINFWHFVVYKCSHPLLRAPWLHVGHSLSSPVSSLGGIFLWQMLKGLVSQILPPTFWSSQEPVTVPELSQEDLSLVLHILSRVT